MTINNFTTLLGQGHPPGLPLKGPVIIFKSVGGVIKIYVIVFFLDDFVF